MARVSGFIALCLLLGLAAAADEGVQQQCAQVASTKLLPCIDYANGKQDEPSSDCCTSVADIRKSQPVCLCFVIQETHSGSPGFKSLGLKVDRLLKLPAICKLANSSASDCPKLLNLSPSSPDYSIFMNGTAATTNSSSSGSEGAAPSNAFIHQMCLYATSVIVFVTAATLFT